MSLDVVPVLEAVKIATIVRLASLIVIRVVKFISVDYTSFLREGGRNKTEHGWQKTIGRIIERWFYSLK